jgi:hypothetical protein
MTLGHTERHIGHTKVRLTARGRFVRNIFIGILALLAFYWADQATTPEKCKVEFEKLDQGCLDLLYPN